MKPLLPPLYKAVEAQITRVGSSNQWNQNRGLTVYSRVRVRMLDGTMYRCFDVASVEAAIKGKGRFTAYLNMVEELCTNTSMTHPISAIYVESVLNPRLRSFLARRGYTVSPTDGFGDAKSYYHLLPNPKPLSQPVAMDLAMRG